MFCLASSFPLFSLSYHSSFHSASFCLPRLFFFFPLVFFFLFLSVLFSMSFFPFPFVSFLSSHFLSCFSISFLSLSLSFSLSFFSFVVSLPFFHLFRFLFLRISSFLLSLVSRSFSFLLSVPSLSSSACSSFGFGHSSWFPSFFFRFPALFLFLFSLSLSLSLVRLLCFLTYFVCLGGLSFLPWCISITSLLFFLTILLLFLAAVCPSSFLSAISFFFPPCIFWLPMRIFLCLPPPSPQPLAPPLLAFCCHTCSSVSCLTCSLPLHSPWASAFWAASLLPSSSF